MTTATQDTTEAAPATSVEVPTAAIALQAGEHYAGLVLDRNTGQPLHHLILLPQQGTDLEWASAKAWAEEVGGDLPTRQEQALLFANCKPHLRPRWHWSSETHQDDASYAWFCLFNYGDQNFNRKSFQACAVSVRLIPVTA